MLVAEIFIKRASKFLLQTIIMISMIGASLCCGQAYALTLNSKVEIIKISSVGNAFQTVNFENTYTNAVPVCTYTLPSATNGPATVRINNITASSMQVRIQEFETTTGIAAGLVTCLISDTGASLLPDGRRIEARTAVSTTTAGRAADHNFQASQMQNMSSQFSGFTTPLAFGQVISYNDSRASVFHANDCESRQYPPFMTGFADGICATKHIGKITGSRNNETIGVIVIESGTGTYRGRGYKAALGSDTIQGVGNSPPYTYGLGSAYEYAIATQAAEDGGDGGWAVTYGSSPMSGTNLNLAIDEEKAAGNTSRGHTHEQVAYFVVISRPEFTASLEVDFASITEPKTLNYTLTLENDYDKDQTGVSVTPTLPDGTTASLTGPTESIATDGIFEPGEIWTYNYTYSVTQAEINAGTTRTSSISATTNEYSSSSIVDETASASTTIIPAAPSIKITKTADKTVEVAAGEVVTYTYVVENTGNQTISNLELSDVHNGSGAAPEPKNENLTADNDISGDSSDATSNDGIWEKLGPGDEVTFTAIYTVTQNDLDTLQ